MAVLEFELRKARETIFTLREELTQQTKTPRELQENYTDTVDINTDHGNSDIDDESLIKAHEQRIVNFLINEYLLQYGYKLTSITFSDENNDADYFEDWDNIGINVTKPPNLLKLYRDYGKHFHSEQCGIDVEIMTDKDPRITDLEQKSSNQNEQLILFESQITELETTLEQQNAANQQLTMQLREKESVIEILRAHDSLEPVKTIILQESENNPQEILEIMENPSRFVQLITDQCSPCIDDHIDINQNFIEELSTCLPKIGK